jgi:hypothetical protein
LSIDTFDDNDDDNDDDDDNGNDNHNNDSNVDYDNDNGYGDVADDDDDDDDGNYGDCDYDYDDGDDDDESRRGRLCERDRLRWPVFQRGDGCPISEWPPGEEVWISSLETRCYVFNHCARLRVRSGRCRTTFMMSLRSRPFGMLLVSG